MKIILSIKPKFAKQIFTGKKKYEYRKVIFKDERVTHVVVYASAPISKVIGEFEIDTVLKEPIDELWKLTKEHGGVDKEFFNKYFEQRKEGYAIQIKETLLYDIEFDIYERYGVKPPQSFVYLK
jgi:predicted transcriptional regulator